MAIGIKSATAGTDNGGSATVSVTTSESPSATQVGDLVVFFYGNNYYALSNMGTPSVTGSPTLTNFATVDAGANQSHIRGYWYVANTAGAQTISATETGSHDEEKFIVAVVLSGANATTPVDGTAGTNFSATSVSSWTAPATSPTATDSFLLTVCAAGGGSAPASYTTPGPLTEQLEFHQAGASGVLAYQQLSASGSTGTFAFTPASSSPYGAMTVAISTGGAAPPAAGSGELVRVPPAPLGTPWRGPRIRPFQMLGDATTLVASLVSLDDAGSGADAVTVTAAAALDDAAAGTDAVTVSATASLADTGAGSDAVTVTVAASIADTGSGTDSVSVAATVSIADTGAGADTISADAAVPLADTGTGADAVSVTVTTTIGDTATGADALSVQTGTDQNQAWPGVAWMFLSPNSASVQMGGSRVTSGDQVIGLPDTATGADALTAAASVPLADTATGTDALTVTVTVALADTGTGADTLTTTATVVLDDPASGADSITVQAAGSPDPHQAWPQTGGWWLRRPNVAASFQLAGSKEFGDQAINLADTGSAADAFTVAVAVTLADTAVGADSLSATATAVLSDTGTGTDSLGVTATVPLTDTGSGADAISVSGSSSPQLPDTASGVDTVTVAATVALTDTSTALDAMTVARAAFLDDTATAVDGFTVVVAVSLTDTGVAVDVFSGPVFDRTITRGRAVLGNPNRRQGRGSW